MRNRTLAAVASLSFLSFVSPMPSAFAGVIDFSFLEHGVTDISGSFSYSDALQGQVLSFANLSTFSVDILKAGSATVGKTYNLSFVTSPTNVYSYFSFNTSTDQFIGASVNGPAGPFDELFGSITSNASDGFFIGDIGNQVYLQYPHNTGTPVGNGYAYDQILVTSVPEPSSLIVLGMGLCLGVGFYRRRLPQDSQTISC